MGGAYSSEERVCNQCFRHQNGHTPSVPPPHPASKGDVITLYDVMLNMFCNNSVSHAPKYDAS